MNWKVAFFVMLLAVACSGCIGGTKNTYVCYDKTIVDSKELCPRFVCYDGRVVASPKICTGEEVSQTVSTTIPEGNTLGTIGQPAEGPAGVYIAYHDAIIRGDYDGMKKYVYSKRKAELEKAGAMEVRFGFELIKALEPARITVNNVSINGNLALVEVSGEGRDLSGNLTSMAGLVRMVAEDGAWKVNTEKWMPKHRADDMRYFSVENQCKGLGDESKCDSLDMNFDRRECFSCFAQLRGEPELCEKAGVDSEYTIYLRDECYEILALRRGDAATCSKLSTEKKIQACVKAIQ